MVRAVRLAATLDFDDRAGDARRDRGARRARRATSPASGSPSELEQAARRAERRRSGCGSLADTGLLDGDRARARGAARASPRTRSPARTCGTTRCGPSTRRRRPPDRPARGARPRHRQAGDARRRPLPTATTSSGRELARRAPRRLHVPARRRSTGRPSRRATTCSRTTPIVGRRRASGGSSPRSGAASLDELFELRRADNIGSGAPADARRPRRAPGAGRAGSSRPRSRSTGAISPSTATTSSPSSARTRSAPRRAARRAGRGGRRGPGLNDRPTLLLLAQSRLASED